MEHQPFYTKLAQSVRRVKAAKRMLKTGETYEEALAAIQNEKV